VLDHGSSLAYIAESPFIVTLPGHFGNGVQENAGDWQIQQ
jgi:hypothetical protein